jgi:hypothetical protein
MVTTSQVFILTFGEFSKKKRYLNWFDCASPVSIVQIKGFLYDIFVQAVIWSLYFVPNIIRTMADKFNQTPLHFKRDFVTQADIDEARKQNPGEISVMANVPKLAYWLSKYRMGSYLLLQTLDL